MKEKILTIMFSLFCLTAAGQNNQNSTLLGDANGDGVIDQDDITELKNNILGIQSESFKKDNADVNRDEHINVADIVGLVDIYNDLNYRVYEFNYENERIKKIYLDNEGMLYSSATGDFGANDTICIKNGNQSPMFVVTDEKGELETIYTHGQLFHFYYDEDGMADIIEINNTDCIIHHTTYTINDNFAGTRGVKIPSKAFKSLNRIKYYFKTEEGKKLLKDTGLSTLINIAEVGGNKLANIIAKINDNPENHNLKLIRDGLFIASDVVSMTTLLGATIASGGLASPVTVPLLGLALYSYYSDIEEFINELVPDSDRMKKYADYYKKKYAINLSIYDPDNVTPQNLTLHGGLLTQDGENRKGNAYFYYWILGKDSRYKEEAKYNKLSVGTYQLSLDIPIESGSDYFASVNYEFRVKGLNLTISSETITFKTPYELSPMIMDFKQTGSEYKKDAFTNNNKKYSYKFNCATTVDIEMLFDVEDWGYIYLDPDGGKKKISLMEFGTNYTDTRYAYYRNEPKSTVTFQPYVKYKVDTEKVALTRAVNDDEDGYWYGEPVTFDLIYEPQLCPDDNHPHMIDLGLPSGTKWACCNVGASSPESNGHFYAWGDGTEKSEFDIDTYAYQEYSETAKSVICSYIGENISGTQFDIALQKWGSPWRMPSKEDFNELINNCEVFEVTYKGERGTLIVSPNGKQLFLKPQGYRDCCELHGTEQGVLWTSTYSHEPPIEAEWQKTIYAYAFLFYGDYLQVNGYHSRVYGYAIRPVTR